VGVPPSTPLRRDPRRPFLSFSIPTRAYGALARILRLPGSEGFARIQRDIFPVQELSRILQSETVRIFVYDFTLIPVANTQSELQFRDFSDWTSVTLMGRIPQVLSADTDLPDVNDDGIIRIVTDIGLSISGTSSHYESAAAVRTMSSLSPGSNTIPVAQWGDLVAGRIMPNLQQFPYVLQPPEANILLDQRIQTGVLASFEWTIIMAVADRGVFGPVLGF